jgi:hypothetical protein
MNIFFESNGEEKIITCQNDNDIFYIEECQLTEIFLDDIISDILDFMSEKRVLIYITKKKYYKIDKKDFKLKFSKDVNTIINISTSSKISIEKIYKSEKLLNEKYSIDKSSVVYIFIQPHMKGIEIHQCIDKSIIKKDRILIHTTTEINFLDDILSIGSYYEDWEHPYSISLKSGHYILFINNITIQKFLKMFNYIKFILN